MDKWLEGAPLKVVEAGAILILSTNTTDYRYHGITNPTIPVENKAPSR